MSEELRQLVQLKETYKIGYELLDECEKKIHRLYDVLDKLYVDEDNLKMFQVVVKIEEVLWNLEEKKE